MPGRPFCSRSHHSALWVFNLSRALYARTCAMNLSELAIDDLAALSDKVIFTPADKVAARPESAFGTSTNGGTAIASTEQRADVGISSTKTPSGKRDAVGGASAACQCLNLCISSGDKMRMQVFLYEIV